MALSCTIFTYLISKNTATFKSGHRSVKVIFAIFAFDNK